MPAPRHSSSTASGPSSNRDDDPAAAAPLVCAQGDDGDLDGHLVSAEMSGSVWKVLVEPGQHVEAGAPLLVVEAMKMELAVTAPVAGTVKAVRCAPGKAVTPGDALLLAIADHQQGIGTHTFAGGVIPGGKGVAFQLAERGAGRCQLTVPVAARPVLGLRRGAAQSEDARQHQPPHGKGSEGHGAAFAGIEGGTLAWR